MKNKSKDNGNKISRRDFIKTSAAVSMAAVFPSAVRAYPAGSDTVKIALVGCGDRGTDAAINAIESSKGVELVAMADLFKDRMDNATKKLKDKFPAKVKVTDDSCFLGFDAYKKVLESDADIVLLATPPHFRPQQLKAVIEAGKNAFIEKPAAVDPVGVRQVIEASELAKKKKLSIVAGTQQRRQPQYIEVIKRVHNGQIGKIVTGQCYWHWGYSDWHYAKRNPKWSDMEYQIRTWPYYVWLSGDHIVEQHLHNLDIINWAIGTHPVQCMAVGGRQSRTGEGYGNIYDHFAVEYEYPGGVRVLSMSSQIKGSTGQVCERLVGTKGQTYTTRATGYIEGQEPYKYEGPGWGGFVKEHADLIEAVRKGEPINEGRQVAESTLTAIMGRISAYTGRALKWDWVMKASKLDLSPPKYELGDLPVKPVAVPGKTALV